MVKGNVIALKSSVQRTIDGHVMDAGGLTPLHHAAERGLSPECVSILLQQGVSPHVVTPDGSTPADLARRAGHQRVLAVLSQHKCEKVCWGWAQP